jgi:hypothetical protein
MSSYNESTESVIGKDNFERGREGWRQSRKHSRSGFPVLAAYISITSQERQTAVSLELAPLTHHAGPSKDVSIIKARHLMINS